MTDTTAEPFADRHEPWREQARRDGCYCRAYRKPCTRHDGWDDGYEAGVAAERERCARIVVDTATDDKRFTIGDVRVRLFAEAAAAAIRGGDDDS